MASKKQPQKASKEGIGLYTYDQVENTTPFQYLAQIVIGAIFASSGMLGYSQYQLPTRSTGGLVISSLFIVVGTFLGHAGAIFWYGRLRKH